MTRRKTTALAAAPLVGAMLLTACSKEEPPPPPPPPPQRDYTPPPPPPEPVNADLLLQASNADARVQFPQKHAPIDEPFAKAVVSLADAIARGDDSKLRPLLTPSAEGVLDELTNSGSWYDATDAIEAVRVVELDEGARTVSFAVQDPEGAYVLKWKGQQSAGSYQFDGVQSPGTERNRASDFDGGVPEITRVSTSAPSAPSLGYEPGSPLETYAFVELNKAIQRDLGVPVAQDAAVFQLLATQTGRSADALGNAYLDGESAYYNGTTLDTAARTELVDAFVTITKAQGLGITRPRIEELLDEVLAPRPDRDARDPNEIIKQTPSGPVRIPNPGGP